jgi:hypothetical protein
MTKPTIKEIEDYLIEKKEYRPDEAKIFADKFWNYYESVGWKVGDRKQMASWTAAIRTWEIKNKDNAHKRHNTEKLGTSEARLKAARDF